MDPLTLEIAWGRYVIVLMLAALTLLVFRTPVIVCTVVAVCGAGLAAGFCPNEQRAMLMIFSGVTAGPFVGVMLDAYATRERRTMGFIGRRYARPFVCPNCGNQFNSIQTVGQCPQCNTQFAGTGKACR